MPLLQHLLPCQHQTVCGRLSLRSLLHLHLVGAQVLSRLLAASDTVVTLPGISTQAGAPGHDTQQLHVTRLVQGIADLLTVGGMLLAQQELAQASTAVLACSRRPAALRHFCEAV